MENITQFDVLIVYSEAIAMSAAAIYSDSVPFPLKSKQAQYNNAYAYFLTTCAKNNITAAFTTSADIIGNGLCKSYWLFKNKQWIKVKNACFSTVIFDKFSPVSKKQEINREILFSSPAVIPFNDTYLLHLFFDKQKTFTKLERFSIPTVSVENSSKKSIAQACQELEVLIKKHPYRTDFSRGIVLKDRFGSGGNYIYKFSTNIQHNIYNTMQKYSENSFILQPFTKFNKGYSYKGSSGFTDIRLIYIGKKVIQRYIRIAKKTDFRCNEHQGGVLTYIIKKDIPTKILDTALEIVQLLDKEHALFTLDFIVSNNNNVYFVEGNTGPGIHWNESKKKDERMSKRLIQCIVKELTQRVRNRIHENRFPVYDIQDVYINSAGSFQ